MVDLSKRAANPFEAPQSEGRELPTQGTPGELDPVLAMKQGWEATTRNFAPWLAVMFAGSLVAILVSITVIGIFVVLPVLMWGSFKFLLNTVDGHATFGDFFSGFSRYGEALGGMIGYVGLAIIAGLPGSALSYADIAMQASGNGSAVVGALGTAVSMVWFFLVSIRFVFAPFYIVDQQMGPVEAMRASWDATRHRRLPTALFFVLLVAVMVVGFIALIIGIIPAVMVAYSGYAAAYRQISGTGPGSAAPPSAW